MYIFFNDNLLFPFNFENFTDEIIFHKNFKINLSSFLF